VVIGRELGVLYPLRPFAGLATGIYVDQRATRVWLAPHVAGKHVLNLFAYTGAFSLAALKSGAASAMDVDLAAPALARASEAAALNGVTERHAIHQGDCRKFLQGTDRSFDLIICDPPTAAHGGDGWILRRDYPEVLCAAFARLAPGGILVACCNTLGGKPFPLGEVVKEAAKYAHVGIHDMTSPALGEDIPVLGGFPEGRPYRLIAVRR
jgi:23S rRNA (cytosine1962-C5)-methyltransferase